ncbi:MAG: NAD(P)H-hydrate dehydratase [Bacteroidia bacterium]|nr:NAD(P)H-hydrate dehydratase [Bacteroidia bacterium]
MKILSSSLLREADQYTIEHEPITSLDLMERAAMSCVKWIEENLFEKQYTVICGLGNNGGDGLAIARLLIEKKCRVNVIVVNYSSKQSVGFKENYNRLALIAKIKDVNIIAEFVEEIKANEQAVIIDALIGTGTNKSADGFLKECINYINQFNSCVVSIDVPSGLYTDVLNQTSDSIIKADYTLTFQCPKLSFMFPENAQYVGLFSILDIGLNNDFIQRAQAPYQFIVAQDVKVFLKKRDIASHKGNYGHALLIAGSYGKIGAAVLASKACMRAGVGLLTTHVPKCGYEIMQTAIPEAMVQADSEMYFINDHPVLDKYDALGIGPGIGLEKQTQNVLKLIIQNATAPIVFDADALNILAENKTWLSFLPHNSILTPHPKEFERLAGKTSNTNERLKLQVEFSVKHNVIIVLKGAHTSISFSDGTVCFNSTGNAGMATAGSGDVLTGIIASLLAQKYTPSQAAILGVYLHGLAGDFSAKKISMEAMIASDIIENISDSFHFLIS